MKRSKEVISILLCMLLIIQTACGNTNGGQNAVGNGADQTEAVGNSGAGDVTQIPQETTPRLTSDWLTSAGDFTKTWEKDYTSEEWTDGICLNMYVHDIRSENSRMGIIEEELNHRLHMAGYGFYIHFEQPSYEEYHVDGTFDIAIADELVAEKQQSGMTIDLYTTYDYKTAVENGVLLELTDYLYSDAGSGLYTHFDPIVWQQLENEDGRIYGIPMNPVATSRYAYAYSPQLADILGIDMSVFNGDISVFEEAFPGMVEQGIVPINLDCRKDLLMVSLFGLENYGDIFAVRHTEDDWEAVDLFEEEEVISFYEQLGDWKEKGFLAYDVSFLIRLGDEAPLEMSSDRFDYRFINLVDRDTISWFYDVNWAENGFVETAFYVSQRPAFIMGNRNSEILVIDANTAYPEECMQFLNLLTTDEEIRMLLYSGIENEAYIWQDDVQIFDNFGGGYVGCGLEYDLRFWPVGHWGEKYATEIEDMNRDVSDGISLTVDCDFAGLEEQYETCRQLFEDNILVFLGYYGAETGERLQVLHEQLNEAGYQELIAAVNAMHE